MKKFLPLLLCCILLIGCSAPAAEPTDPPVLTEAPAASIVTTEAPETETPTEIPETEPPVLLSYQMYLPNDNADGFDVQTVETSQITAESVLAELQAAGVLPDTVVINAFGAAGNQLNIDFNQAFADLICSMGTAGEMMITGSVVNTYITAFQAESVYFTINGNILESGHVVYDFPLTFTE